MKKNRYLRRVLSRWEHEARELYYEHKGVVPIRYWLHQTKHHYKKMRPVKSKGVGL